MTNEIFSVWRAIGKPDISNNLQQFLERQEEISNTTTTHTNPAYRLLLNNEVHPTAFISTFTTTPSYFLISFDSSLKTRGLGAPGAPNYTKFVFSEITCDKYQRALSSESFFNGCRTKTANRTSKSFLCWVTLCPPTGLTIKQNVCSCWTGRKGVITHSA